MATLIKILTNWAYVFYYQGDFKKLLELLTAHEKEAASLNDEGKNVMFYAWIGWAYGVTGKVSIAYERLLKARDMAEERGDRKALGYALTWLSNIAAFVGKFDEGLDAGKKAVEIGKSFPSDQYLTFKGLFGVAAVHLNMGDLRSAIADNQALLDYGRKHSDHRSLSAGYGCVGLVHFYKGDIRSALECGEKSLGIARDPFFVLVCKTFLGGFYLLAGRTVDAEKELREVVDFDERFNVFAVDGLAHLYLAMLNIIKGQINEGVKTIERLRDRFSADGHMHGYVLAEQLLGEVYLKMVEGSGPKSLSLVARNIPFLLSNLPFADSKAQKHLNEAIKASREIGAKASLCQAYLNLGLLHRAKKRKDKAMECLSEAARLLGECEADEFLRQAKEALELLGQPTGPVGRSE